MSILTQYEKTSYYNEEDTTKSRQDNLKLREREKKQTNKKTMSITKLLFSKTNEGNGKPP